jgi:hypothetical protein
MRGEEKGSQKVFSMTPIKRARWDSNPPERVLIELRMVTSAVRDTKLQNNPSIPFCNSRAGSDG